MGASLAHGGSSQALEFIVSLSHFHVRPGFFKHARLFARGPGIPSPWRRIDVPHLAPVDPDLRGEHAMRNYTAPAGADSEELTLAYLRYVELHGHALHDPRGGCFVRTRRSGRSETKTFGFWSHKAARDFEMFWERYRLVYGHDSHHGLAAA